MANGVQPFPKWIEGTPLAMVFRLLAGWGAGIVNFLNYISPLVYQETTASYNLLSAGQTILVQPSNVNQQYKVRDIRLVGTGTNFNSGGDRALTLESADGNILYTTIPAATLKSLVNAKWGDTAVPYPSGNINNPTPAGVDLILKYTGGTTDYTSGSLTLIVNVEKVA